MDGLEDFESMFSILGKVTKQGCHDMIKKAGDKFRGTGRHNRSDWVVKFVDLGRKYLTGVRGVTEMRLEAVAGRPPDAMNWRMVSEMEV